MHMLSHLAFEHKLKVDQQKRIKTYKLMFLRMPSNYKGIWKGSQLVQAEAHEYIHILFSILNLLSFVYKKIPKKLESLML